ncbi:NAD(P)-binding protein [Aspergillus steynii IBT 23096]|uniref:NAD(P)-binding protein n=1 Tax=Aspergillus steynii IBT 23096 TaxID=1392250 RepID=A0A2I2GJC8_9EURO|nr:NAD(P)-binding protein [Aspergillus steynii IBT 23096]PLB52991.1 NAD(P)-binding protein [Aspergillus steynii IBT 23096]
MAFNPSTDIPALANKVILVTGGSEGLGKQTIQQLATHSPAKIYLAARNPAKGESALQEIRSNAGPDCAPISLLTLDLSSLDSVKAAAAEIHARETRLDILITNAGVMGAKGVTQEGYEMQFGVNHVGHALLIQLLLPLLLATAAREDVTPGATRCVVLASDAEKFAPRTDPYPFEKLRTPCDDLSAFTRYGISKLANVHYAAQLARRHPEAETGVRFVSLHPGAVITNLGDLMRGWPRTEKIIRKVVAVVIGMVPVEQGVWGQLWAATWPVGKQTEELGEPQSGTFYHPVGVEGKGSKLAYDESKAKELWEWTEKELQPHLST